MESEHNKEHLAHTPGGVNIKGLLNLLVVYIVWGSTYLAIRVAVRPGAGWPPFMLGAFRVLAGGCLLLLFGALQRKRLRPTMDEFRTLALSGLLLWVGGNGLVNWAEQRADSGLAALIIAATPIWVAMIEAVLDRRLPSKLLILSLFTGFAGIAVLSAPVLITGMRADGLAFSALLLAGLSWGGGTVLQSRKPMGLAVHINSAYQQLLGGLGFLLIAGLLGEPMPSPSPQAWLAWGYLVLFGSVIAFTSFIQALRLLPANIVTTYGYVNPVIAVILGWLILGEPVTIWTIIGAGLVLLGVTGVFRDRYASKG